MEDKKGGGKFELSKVGHTLSLKGRGRKKKKLIKISACVGMLGGIINQLTDRQGGGQQKEGYVCISG
jgi:hypothetical protein